MNLTLISIVVPVVITLGGYLIWKVLNNAEKKGKAEAAAEATAKAEEINAGMTDIQGTVREPSEVVGRLKTGKFGGQKE